MEENRFTWRFGVILAITWTVLLFLLLPLFVGIPFSFTPKRYLSLPEDSLSWVHYVHLFTSEDWLSSMGQSLFIAICSTVIAVVLGTLCAIGLWRIASRVSEIVRGLLLIPIIVPAVVSGLAFYRIWVDFRLHDTYIAMILSHMILNAPVVVITVSMSLTNFDPKLELAARNLGASMNQTLQHVILPSIKPGILSGALFAFIWSWDEIVVALFITSLRIITLPRRMWAGIQDNADPTIAACASVLIFITVFITLSHMLTRKRGKAGDKPKEGGLGNEQRKLAQ